MGRKSIDKTRKPLSKKMKSWLDELIPAINDYLDELAKCDHGVKPDPSCFMKHVPKKGFKWFTAKFYKKSFDFGNFKAKEIKQEKKDKKKRKKNAKNKKR